MKQSIISIGMTACCLSGNGQSLFAANKPAQEERPNILFILSDDHTSQSWGIYGGVLGEYARNENIRRLAAGPASYGLTDSMGRMHGDAQFAGSSSVPAHVEMMGLIGAGNNPMVGMTVACAVAASQVNA